MPGDLRTYAQTVIWVTPLDDVRIHGATLSLVTECRAAHRQNSRPRVCIGAFGPPSLNVRANGGKQTVTDTPEVKRHISYSALSDYLQCGEMYRLKRLLQLPERPAWWNVGGHAVHSATEAYDRQHYATAGN